MKSLFAIAAVTVILSFQSVLGQNSAAEKLDTIIKVEGKIQPCDVQKVSSSYVKFVVPGSDEVYTYKRSEIHKIIYKNGRIEEYNPPILMMVDDYSWEAVWFTDNPQDVAEMYKRGDATAHSSSSARSPKAAKKNATIRMQKKAAAMKGQVVLYTKKQATGGYGEFPGYYIEGVVYGYEPLDENGELQDESNSSMQSGVVM